MWVDINELGPGIDMWKVLDKYLKFIAGSDFMCDTVIQKEVDDDGNLKRVRLTAEDDVQLTAEHEYSLLQDSLYLDAHDGDDHAFNLRITSDGKRSGIFKRQGDNEGQQKKRNAPSLGEEEPPHKKQRRIPTDDAVAMALQATLTFFQEAHADNVETFTCIKDSLQQMHSEINDANGHLDTIATNISSIDMTLSGVDTSIDEGAIAMQGIETLLGQVIKDGAFKVYR